MQNILTARDGIVPALVPGQVGHRERQAAARVRSTLTDHPPHVFFFLGRTDGSAYGQPPLEQLDDDVRAHEARAARDQYERGGHRRP